MPVVPSQTRTWRRACDDVVATAGAVGDGDGFQTWENY